jgi:hypothetical protein
MLNQPSQPSFLQNGYHEKAFLHHSKYLLNSSASKSKNIPEMAFLCSFKSNSPKFEEFDIAALSSGLSFNPIYAVDFVHEIQNTKEDEHSRKFRARSRGHLHGEQPKREKPAPS